jgi:hypothetical protein
MILDAVQLSYIVCQHAIELNVVRKCEIYFWVLIIIEITKKYEAINYALGILYYYNLAWAELSWAVYNTHICADDI